MVPLWLRAGVAPFLLDYSSRSFFPTSPASRRSKWFPPPLSNPPPETSTLGNLTMAKQAKKTPRPELTTGDPWLLTGDGTCLWPSHQHWGSWKLQRLLQAPTDIFSFASPMSLQELPVHPSVRLTSVWPCSIPVTTALGRPQSPSQCPANAVLLGDSA